jgi:O-antigen/teichoic acid export membrane protein
MTALRFLALFSAKHGSRFRRNFIHAARGNLIAQCILLAATPILTRLYTPDDFAALAMFTAGLSLLTAVGCWRIDWMLPNASSRQQALALVLLGSAVLIVITLITVTVLWFKPYLLDRWKGGQVLGHLIFLWPVALVGTGIQQLLQAWFVREANLAATSQARVAQSVANTGLSLAGGGIGLGPFGLIGSTVVSTWVGIGTLLRQSMQHLGIAGRLTAKRIAVTGRKFASEATWSTAISTVNMAGNSVMVLLLAQYFPAKEVGWFALMHRVAIAPIGIITQGVAQSFWAESAQLVRSDKKRLKALYLRTTWRLFLLSIPVALLCLAGPIYVGILFGKTEWSGGGLILAMLAPMIVGSITFSPTNHLVVFYKQKYQMVVDFTRFSLIFVCIFGSAASNLSIYSAVLLSSLASIGSHALLLFIHLRFCYGTD